MCAGCYRKSYTILPTPCTCLHQVCNTKIWTFLGDIWAFRTFFSTKEIASMYFTHLSFSDSVNSENKLIITATESCQSGHRSIVMSDMYKIPNLLYTSYKCDHWTMNPSFTLSTQINLDLLLENILHNVKNQTKDGVILFYDSVLGEYLMFRTEETTSTMFDLQTVNIYPISTEDRYFPLKKKGVCRSSWSKVILLQLIDCTSKEWIKGSLVNFTSEAKSVSKPDVLTVTTLSNKRTFALKALNTPSVSDSITIQIHCDAWVILPPPIPKHHIVFQGKRQCGRCHWRLV